MHFSSPASAISIILSIVFERMLTDIMYIYLPLLALAVAVQIKYHEACTDHFISNSQTSRLQSSAICC